MKPKDQMRTLFLIDSLLHRMAFQMNWQALLNSWESLITFSETWVYFLNIFFLGGEKQSIFFYNIMILPSTITFILGLQKECKEKKTVKPHKTKALMFRDYQSLSFLNKFDVIKNLCQTAFIAIPNKHYISSHEGCYNYTSLKNTPTLHSILCIFQVQSLQFQTNCLHSLISSFGKG